MCFVAAMVLTVQRKAEREARRRGEPLEAEAIEDEADFDSIPVVQLDLPDLAPPLRCAYVSHAFVLTAAADRSRSPRPPRPRTPTPPPAVIDVDGEMPPEAMLRAAAAVPRAQPQHANGQPVAPEVAAPPPPDRDIDAEAPSSVSVKRVVKKKRKKDVAGAS